MCACVYLVNEEKQRLSETTVFLCQVAIPPFLLFQDLPLALPQVRHILTVLLNTHVHTEEPLRYLGKYVISQVCVCVCEHTRESL